MKNRLRFSAGLTLTEVVVAVMLLAMVWLIALNAILMAKSGGSFSKHKSQAMYVIQRTIEDLRKKTFSTISSRTSAVSIDTRGTPNDPSDDLTGTQIVTVTSPSAYYKKIVVEVRWNEIFAGGNKAMREYCGTFISNDPQAN